MRIKVYTFKKARPWDRYLVRFGCSKAKDNFYNRPTRQCLSYYCLTLGEDTIGPHDEVASVYFDGKKGVDLKDAPLDVQKRIAAYVASLSPSEVDFIDHAKTWR